MQTIRERAREHFPSVLLTLLSIIQALALELWWSRLRESGYFWSGGFDAVVGWTQAVVLLLGIVQVWLFYTSLVMRFRWTPSLQDSLMPFAIGILEFALVDLMGPETLSLWFAAFGVIFGLSVFTSQSAFRRARQDPDNREFFDQTSPARLSDFAESAAAVGGLFLLSLVTRAHPDWGWLGLLGLLATGGALLHQIELMRRFWNRTMGFDAGVRGPDDVG